MAITQAWLPDKCLADPRLSQPVASIVAAWCAHWFAAPAWTVGDHWVRKLPQNEDKLAPAFDLENGLTGLLADRGKLHLSGAMLGLPLDKGTPGKADAQLINALADKALADLGERLSTLATVKSVGEGGAAFYIPVDWPTYRLTIFNKARQPMLAVEADRQALVSLANAQAPTPRSQPMPVSRDIVLEHLRVRIGAKIGAAKLTLSELEALGVGDVIPLDRPVDGRLGMTVDGHEKMAAAFAIKPEQETLQMQLVRSIF